MSNLYVTKRPHRLNLARDAKDFCRRFHEETGVTVDEHVGTVVSLDKVLDIVLAGSIPLGSGTGVSDIDLLVLVDDESALAPSQTESDNRKFNSAHDKLVSSQIISMINGVECDVQIVRYSSVSRIYAHLAQGSVSLTQAEVIVLSRLRTGWRFGGALSSVALRDDLFLFQEDYLELYCSTRDYAFALKDIEDARAAVGDNLLLALHLGRLAVEKCCTAYFASRGYAFLGSKWMRFIRANLERISDGHPGVAPAFEQATKLMFPNGQADASEACAYLDEVVEFARVLRRIICLDVRYGFAFKACGQIYEV